MANTYYLYQNIRPQRSDPDSENREDEVSFGLDVYDSKHRFSDRVLGKTIPDLALLCIEQGINFMENDEVTSLDRPRVIITLNNYFICDRIDMNQIKEFCRAYIDLVKQHNTA